MKRKCSSQDRYSAIIKDEVGRKIMSINGKSAGQLGSEVKKFFKEKGM